MTKATPSASDKSWDIVNMTWPKALPQLPILSSWEMTTWLLLWLLLLPLKSLVPPTTFPSPLKTRLEVPKDAVNFLAWPTEPKSLRLLDVSPLFEWCVWLLIKCQIISAERTTPFVINYFSELDTSIAVTSGQTTGFNLEYTQVPC